MSEWIEKVDCDEDRIYLLGPTSYVDTSEWIEVEGGKMSPLMAAEYLAWKAENEI